MCGSILLTFFPFSHINNLANVDPFRANNQIDIQVMTPGNIDQSGRLTTDSMQLAITV